MKFRKNKTLHGFYYYKKTTLKLNLLRPDVHCTFKIVMMIIAMGVNNAQSKLLHVPVATHVELGDRHYVSTMYYQPYLVDIPQYLAESPAKDYNLSNVIVLPSFFTTYDAQVGGGVYDLFEKSKVNGETVQDYLIRLYNNGEFSGSFRKDGPTSAAVCQGFAIAHDNQLGIKRNAKTMQAAYQGIVVQLTFPIQSTCAETPPDPKYCELKTESISLDFKTLNRSMAADATASDSIEIYCEEPTKIELREPFSGLVPLSNGGVAELYQNGQSLSAGATSVSIAGGETHRVNISAKLKEPGQAGFFEGISVLSLSYP
ncbi:hypothetical protein [Enterobacter quasiroggenkampii]|uniref:MrpH family fimbial adhesin n=1 Tax=Enterobacter quasiroggenkampii TaxID=2497436 RepID=UPI00200490AB|nr:hypothetical protein [Enterobacter quasiroggenkampii]MCK7310706.1 hypothetical protein [Enterobacter quasiroggenkampii]